MNRFRLRHWLSVLRFLSALVGGILVFFVFGWGVGASLGGLGNPTGLALFWIGIALVFNPFVILAVQGIWLVFHLTHRMIARRSSD